MRKSLVYLLILSIFLSEIALLIKPVVGFFFYAALLTCVLVIISKSELNNLTKLLYILMIFPLIRISELFINLNFLWKNLAVYYFILFMAVFYSFKFKINIGYTKKNLWMLALVIILAVFLGFLGNNILNLTKHIEILFIIPIIAFSEEVLFRGLIQNLLKIEFGALISILSTALIYAILSLSFGIYSAIFLFFVSLIISLIYNFSRNIFLAIFMNLIISLFLFVIPKIRL